MKKVFRSTSIALSLALTAGLFAPAGGLAQSVHAAEQEFVPYYGTGPSYIQPENIAHLFPKPDVKFDTPGFQEGKVAFTSQEEMMDVLKQIAHKNRHAKLKILGKSAEGRDIPLLYFSKNSHHHKSKAHKKKPLVWVQSQIHGNEPASGESTLVLAKLLAEGRLGNVLDKVDIAIVPRVNPDGSYYFKRFVANDMDANRDYMKAEYVEVQTVHKAINAYQPDVVLDSHEYTVNSSQLKQFGEKGSLQSYDLLISSAKNLNIPAQLRKTSDNLLLPNVHKTLDKAKLSHHDYYTLALEDGQLVATEGSTETRIGRNALGLKNTLTYLIETRGINIGRADFERRVYAQVVAQASFIKNTAAHADKVTKAVQKARKEVILKGLKANDHDKIVVTSENKRVPDQKLEVVDLAKAEKVDIPIVWEDSTEAYPTLERERPTAYILPPGHDDVARKLQILGVRVEKLSRAAVLPVESYNVTSSTISKTPESGHYTNKVTTDVTKKKQAFPAGSYVFHMAQPNANFIALALEPESVDSYVTFNYIPVKQGDEIPVYRYMEGKRLRTK
ncbi:M14 family metallopeptidase [Fictibacillus aquaticus]|uniref:Peptidase n=1 Tax=Fictibacillus aquaticus TaxID=2021314 RepID=A0A235F8V1_9BACL|nr:M14 family metallopeptidase [Fictibacillus aquaticus]OYD57682.1 peptidase [Fictibacillus aquaticus]